ncbi:MAG TPA: hypothetical protein VFJ22_21275 [Dermatophilaceae bacterium]|nr:hypothetical protein [Dermatophilaceae bacterium]
MSDGTKRDLVFHGHLLARTTSSASTRESAIRAASSAPAQASPACPWLRPSSAPAAADAETVEAAHDVGGGKLVAAFRDGDGNMIGLVQEP